MIKNIGPNPNVRCWYDPWLLMAEIIFDLFGAMVIIVSDVIAHFMGVMPIDHITYNFKRRLELAYTTVPDYLDELKDAKTYNKEVYKHGIEVHK